jgi:D-xylose transport system permease protein
MSSTITPVDSAAPPPPAAATVGSYMGDYWRRVRGGEVGSLPAILAIVVLSVIFQSQSSKFLSLYNFANLFTQGAAVTVIAMGLVFVLLIGEIDLSAGYTAGACGVTMSLLVTQVPGFPLPHGNAWWVGVLAALAFGAVIGSVIGFLVTRLNIPSFVVTLAGYLSFQGIMLLLLGNGKEVRIEDKTIRAIESDNVNPTLGWALFGVIVVAFAGVQLDRARARSRRGLAAEPVVVIAARILGLAILLGALTFVLNSERSLHPNRVSVKGVPIVALIIGVLLIGGTLVLSRTAYGRHLYAVGGNREAARRAGINVNRVRVSAFVICSTMAAIGGIILASRVGSVDGTVGGADTLLDSVGAAVIGGTSLMGGRGRLVDAVLGGAVIAIIINGMTLMQLSSGLQFAFTGIVLLAAATVDAVSRKRAAASA